MEGIQPVGIYLLAGLLYALPCSLLWAAWRRETGTLPEGLRPSWRASCSKVAFVAAGLATALSLVFLFSYLRNGGGIHGSRTSPGLWNALGPVSAGMLVSSLLLATAGRSKGKLLLIGCVLGVFAAEYVVFQVAFD
jgi:hypothetical protein